MSPNIYLMCEDIHMGILDRTIDSISGVFIKTKESFSPNIIQNIGLRAGIQFLNSPNMESLMNSSGFDFLFLEDAEVSVHDLSEARKFRSTQLSMQFPPKCFGKIKILPDWSILEVYDRAKPLVDFPTFSQSDANIMSDFGFDRERRGFLRPVFSDMCVYINDPDDKNVDFLKISKNFILDLKNEEEIIEFIRVLESFS